MDQWIERKIMPDILDAVEAKDRSTHVFAINSEGGTGKTVLLRQIGMRLGSVDGTQPAPGWSGILDLYHSDVNTNSGLEEHLQHALETVMGEFQLYRDNREAFAHHRESGLSGAQLEAERERMGAIFSRCINNVTRFRRVVIALDTTERIQYEVDDVQRLCEIEEQSTAMKAWILDQVCRWENCVVLLVGRPEQDPYLATALLETLEGHPSVRYKALTLGSFDEDESRAYFDLKQAQYPVLQGLEPSFYQRLGTVTQGRPIRLDLAIEVIRHGLSFDAFKRQMETEDPEQVRAKIDQMLIRQVMNGEPDDSIRAVLTYLAAARKGLDASLLLHLAGEGTKKEWQERLDAIATRGFVKQYPDDDRLYLHDEMYLLCDTYLLRPEQAQSLSQRIVEWYDIQIAAAEDQGDNARRRNLQIESVFYRLRADPVEGYHWYARRTEYAIRAVQVGYDMRLRSELIAFLRSNSPIDADLVRDTPGLLDEIQCDAAVRWVKRLNARGDNQGAIRVAEIILRAKLTPCQSGAPQFQLARTDLGVYYAQALLYAGRAQEAADQLQPLIADLEQGRPPEMLAQVRPLTYQGERRNLVLGRAHNNLGYVNWMHLGHYAVALRQFRAATPYYRASDLQEELANTNDNMGRVYALMRRPTRAESLVDSALDLRRALGRTHRTALSLNSRAIVHLEFGEYLQAERKSRQALDMFQSIGSQRGIGLASITLGRALTQLGSLWEPDIESYQDLGGYLAEGAEHLENAVRIFSGAVDEPVRLVEALNELGSTYLDRARLDQALGQESVEPSNQAIRRLIMCIDLANRLDLVTWYLDSCVDLAEAHWTLGEYTLAANQLDTAYARVPREYLLRGGQPLAELSDAERVEAIWLYLGRIELLRGNLAFDTGTENGGQEATRDVLVEMVRHYVLSVVYFERYSERAQGLKTTFRQMYDRLKGCSFSDLMYLQRTALPDIAQNYEIDMSRFGSFFQDTLGLALQL